MRGWVRLAVNALLTVFAHPAAMAKRTKVRPKVQRAAPAATRRFTIDVSPELHTRIKVSCAQQGLKMADVLRALLEREFPPSKR